MRTWLCLVLVASIFCLDAAAQEAQVSQNPAQLFQGLQAPQTTDNSFEALLILAKSSPETRSYLNDHLPGLIVKGPKNSSQQWSNAVRLAGQLKIVQTAPALTKWIGLEYGDITMTQVVRLDDNPAGKALAQIGDPAISSVSQVLKTGNYKERREAVYVLNAINSSSATEVLTIHLQHESDPGIRSFIERTLAVKNSTESQASRR